MKPACAAKENFSLRHTLLTDSQSTKAYIDTQGCACCTVCYTATALVSRRKHTELQLSTVAYVLRSVVVNATQERVGVGGGCQ